MSNKIIKVEFITPAGVSGSLVMEKALKEGFVIAGKFKDPSGNDTFIMTMDEETYRARQLEGAAATSK